MIFFLQRIPKYKKMFFFLWGGRGGGGRGWEVAGEGGARVSDFLQRIQF